MNRLLFAALAFCAGIPLLLQTEAVAQRDCNSKQFVVSAVNLPPETHLSSQEQATVRLRLVGRCFDESQLTEATDRVRVAFQSFGYFRAKVLLPTVNILDANRRPASVSLTFDVDEGMRYKVREITFLGIFAFKPEQIWAVIPIRVEDFLDTSKTRDALEGLRRLYVSHGYQDATIVPEVKAHDVGHWVSLTFRVVEGSRSE